jgi:hypothetical protein
MPRTTVPVDVAPGGYAGAGVLCTQTAADPTNLNRCVHTGRELILARNTGATARTVTITSVDDPYGRQEHISAESIAAGALRMYGPFPVAGWRQTDGYLYFEASHAEVVFTVIRLP